jgi:hypothetical protein
MSESQFGVAPSSLAETLDELVALARGLRESPSTIPSRLTRLEGLAQMLAKFTVTAPSGPPDTWPIALNTHCAHVGCGRTWRDYDACLLNFARRDESPIWLCRDHHPPMNDGGIRPAGYQTDTATRESVESARKSALAKLSRDELRVVNTRAGG